MVTTGVLQGAGWTVQQRRLGAVTVDVAQPDEPAVSSIVVIDRTVHAHVVAGVEQT